MHRRTLRQIIEKLGASAIFVHPNMQPDPKDLSDTIWLLNEIREQSAGWVEKRRMLPSISAGISAYPPAARVKSRQRHCMYSLNYNEWQIGQSYNPDFTRSEFGRNQTGDDQKKALEIVYKADLEADPAAGTTVRVVLTLPAGASPGRVMDMPGMV